MLHRIRKIIETTPYIVVCEWTNGEIRAISMEEKIKEWAAEPESVYKNLLDKSTFMKVNLDSESQTLFWSGLIKMKDTSGKLFDATLDIDPDVLYDLSIPVKGKRKEDNMAA